MFNKIHDIRRSIDGALVKFGEVDPMPGYESELHFAVTVDGKIEHLVSSVSPRVAYNVARQAFRFQSRGAKAF